MKNRTLPRVIFIILILTVFATAVEPDGNKYSSVLDKGASAAELRDLKPFNKAMTINDLLQWVSADGYYPQRSTQGGSAEYPKGTGGAIYAEGIVWGALVRDGLEPVLRANGSSYAPGHKAGKVLYDGAGNVIGSEDPATRHVWRVRTDYKTADLNEDAGYSFRLDIGDVTATDIQNLDDQYDYDWQNWPADEGAPFNDVDGSGTYDPTVDIPGYPGAAQTIWFVVNDLPDNSGNAIAGLFFGSPAIGIEQQVTMWAYAGPDGQPMNDVIFKNARLIYTGTVDTPDTARLDSMYIGLWSDPDLGVYTDDYIGVDVERSMGYAYNGNVIDRSFRNDFDLPVPAVGYDLLLGPYYQGGYLGLSSFAHIFYSGMSHPYLSSYDNTLEFWNMFRGFMRTPHVPLTPWIDPLTGDTTKFPLSGDPVTNVGWVDGILRPPGDRRMMMSTGPFTMALGDTQEVTFALIGGMGFDNISSIVELRETDDFIQQNYDAEFSVTGYDHDVEYVAGDKSIIRLNVHSRVAATAMTATIKNNMDQVVAVLPLVDDGMHWDGGIGDFLSGGQVELARTEHPLVVSLEIETDENTYSFSDYTTITNDGPLDVASLDLHTDWLNNDGAVNPGEKIHFGFTIASGALFTHSNLKVYAEVAGPVESNNYWLIRDFPDIKAGQVVGIGYDPNDPSTYLETFVLASASGGDSILFHILLVDSLGNEWQMTNSVLIENYQQPGSPTTKAEHVNGAASASVEIMVLDIAALTGDDYAVTFDQQMIDSDTIKQWNLQNLATGYYLLEGMTEFGTFNNGNASEGFVIKVDGTFQPPTDWYEYIHIDPDGNQDIFSQERALTWRWTDRYGKPFIVMTHWANSSRAVDIRGSGTSDIDVLEEDFEFRFTGIMDDGSALNDSTTLYRVSSGGSIATFVYALYYDLAEHPMADDISTERSAEGYFAIRIPFEVWNTDTGQKIDIIIEDRRQDPTKAGGFYAFNPSDLMITYTLNRPYSVEIADVDSGGADEEFLTWNLMFWNTDWTQGDVVRFKYANRIRPGIDRFTFNTTGLVFNEGDGLPTEYNFHQNYPNPFNPSTALRIDLPVATHAKLIIFDLLGREVAVLIDKALDEGIHVEIWKGSDRAGLSLASGIYFARLVTPEYSKTIKMLLVK